MKFAEITEPVPDPFWKLLRQLGVDHVVSLLEHGEVDARNWLTVESQNSGGFAASPIQDADGNYSWDAVPLQRLAETYARAGLTVAVIEDNPPLDQVRLGRSGRDTEIAWFCDQVRSMGLLGIPVLSYSFMSVFDWMRTAKDEKGRGGALVTGYDHRLMADAAPLPGADLSEEDMWSNFEYFLRHVVPVAEEAGVRLALHPDDPPISPVRGLNRIMCSVEALQRAMDIVPSEANALTFCQGNITLMTDDLPAAIRHFGAQRKIAYVHFRDVRGRPEQFVETFQDDGQTDMLACMHAYAEIGFEGVMRTDHVPTVEGDSNARPGYSILGRLFALGYMTGLREAALGTGTSTRSG